MTSVLKLTFNFLIVDVDTVNLIMSSFSWGYLHKNRHHPTNPGWSIGHRLVLHSIPISLLEEWTSGKWQQISLQILSFMPKKNLAKSHFMNGTLLGRENCFVTSCTDIPGPQLRSKPVCNCLLFTQTAIWKSENMYQRKIS